MSTGRLRFVSATSCRGPEPGPVRGAGVVPTLVEFTSLVTPYPAVPAPLRSAAEVADGFAQHLINRRVYARIAGSLLDSPPARGRGRG